jgi:DNA-binding response OmpR family regulator
MATILIVDDERMMCDLLRAVLSRHGHEVITAPRPDEMVCLGLPSFKPVQVF